MSGRVNIPQLRHDIELAVDPDPDSARHYKLSYAAYSDGLLALLDAVEAAHAWHSVSGIGEREAWAAFEQALARFDFSDGDA